MNHHASSAWPCVGPEETRAQLKVLASGNLTYWDGYEGRDFERDFAQFADCEYALGIRDFDTALELALTGLGIGDERDARHEVIVSGLASSALMAGIVRRGAVPVLADIDRETRNITAASVAERMTSRTRAVVAVHEAGLPCEMDGLMALAERHGLAVIEECSQAFGAAYKGRSVGSSGHVACWAFDPDGFMTIGTHDGAMLTTNDQTLYQRMFAYKDQDKRWSVVSESADPEGLRLKPEGPHPDWRLTEVQAAVGRIQLGRLPEWKVARQTNAERLWQTARACPSLRVTAIPAYMAHAAAMATLFVEPEGLRPGWDRDRILAEVNARGVACFSGSGSMVPPDRAFEGSPWRPGTPLPVACELIETSLMFLCHPALTDAEIDRACQVLREVMAESAERRETHYRLPGQQTGAHAPQTAGREIPAASDKELE